MTSPSDLIFEQWSPPWLLTASTLALAAIYTRGWVAIRRTRPTQFTEARLASFLLGLAALWLALASPLDGFADALLSAHMAEHLLLMSVAPPLLLLGLPTVPLLRGVPRGFVKMVLGPLFRSRPLLETGRFLTRPIVAWLAMNATFLVWHAPAAYDYALWNEPWHRFEHICFLSTSLLFWWPVIEPWPARRHDFGWGILLYLISADLINTAQCAFLAFCDRPVYRYYLSQPNPFHIDPVADQAVGAVLMWVMGSLAFLIPAIAATVRLLQEKSRAGRFSERPA